MLFYSRLPNLRTETMKCLATCEQELAVLPKPIDAEPATYMLGLVTSFVNDVERYVRGGPAAGRLIHENRAAFATFKQAIRRTAPNFRPYVTADQTTVHFQNYLGEGEDEGPEDGLLSDMQPFTLTDMQKHIQKSVSLCSCILYLLTSFQDQSLENYLTTCLFKQKLR